MPATARLATLYLAHIHEVRRFLARRVGCRETARELAQETFVRAWGYDAAALGRDARALLYRIATHLACDHFRSAGRVPELLPLAELPAHAEPGSDLFDPVRVVAARQTLTRLAAAIDALPAQCRRAFVLHRFDGLTYPAIARELGIGVNAVEKRLIRALVRLADAL